MSFEIPFKRFTGIIGSSGSGKRQFSTLFAEYGYIRSGSVSFDQVPIEALNLSECLRSGIAFLGQEPFLFDDTIENNLNYARSDASTPDLWKALELANIATGLKFA